jgi:probable rRNA maturation factor
MPDRPSHEIAIIIEDLAWQNLPFDCECYIKEVVLSGLNHVKIVPPLEISVLLTNNQHIQVLNNEYRGQDKPTNVLSFPSLTPEELAHPEPLGELLIMGDIVLAFETIKKEALDQHKTFQHHLAHLTIHGLLHLLGYDHENDADANIMESLEITILKQLNITNPYNYREDYAK